MHFGFIASITQFVDHVLLNIRLVNVEIQLENTYF